MRQASPDFGPSRGRSACRHIELEFNAARSGVQLATIRTELLRPRRDPHHQRGQGVNRVVDDVSRKPPGTIQRE